MKKNEKIEKILEVLKLMYIDHVNNGVISNISGYSFTVGMTPLSPKKLIDLGIITRRSQPMGKLYTWEVGSPTIEMATKFWYYGKEAPPPELDFSAPTTNLNLEIIRKLDRILELLEPVRDETGPE